MVISANDLKWYLESTVSDEQYKIKYYFNSEWFDDLTDIVPDGTTEIDLKQCITDYDEQTLNVYLKNPLIPTTLNEIVKKCKSTNALCKGCPFFKEVNSKCAFFAALPCAWSKVAEDCGYKLEV